MTKKVKLDDLRTEKMISNVFRQASTKRSLVRSKLRMLVSHHRETAALKTMGRYHG
ncbi:MAG: hypothetical protein AAF549_09290 [Pseudomonadota bacterium]